MQLAVALGALSVIGGICALAWRVWRHVPAAVVAGTIVAYAPYVVQGHLYVSGGIPHVLGLGALAAFLACLTGLWEASVQRRPVTPWWWGVAAVGAGVAAL